MPHTTLRGAIRHIIASLPYSAPEAREDMLYENLSWLMADDTAKARIADLEAKVANRQVIIECMATGVNELAAERAALSAEVARLQAALAMTTVDP